MCSHYFSLLGMFSRDLCIFPCFILSGSRLFDFNTLEKREADFNLETFAAFGSINEKTGKTTPGRRGLLNCCAEKGAKYHLFDGQDRSFSQFSLFQVPRTKQHD